MIVTFGLQMAPSCGEVALRLVDRVGVLGVEVGPRAGPHRVALHRHAERVATVVEDPDLAAIRLRVPEDVPRHIHAGDVLLHLVVAPPDAVHPDHVRHRVAAAAVVEGVGQLRPDVLLEVGQVRVVQREHQLVRDQVDDVRPAQAHDQVELDGAGRELRDRLVGGVVRRDLHLRGRLRLELLDGGGVDVVGVVVDPQRATLGRAPVGDPLVLVGDRPCDGVVGARQRQARRAGGLLDDELCGRAGRAGRLGADGRRRVLAACQRADRADPSRGASGPTDELPPVEPSVILGMSHSTRFRFNSGAERHVKAGRELAHATGDAGRRRNRRPARASGFRAREGDERRRSPRGRDRGAGP